MSAPGKTVDSRGRHRLVCVGWDYYDEETRRRRPGDLGGATRPKRRLVGTFDGDDKARKAWLVLIGGDEL